MVLVLLLCISFVRCSVFLSLAMYLCLALLFDFSISLWLYGFFLYVGISLFLALFICYFVRD